jgi:protein gp37
MAKRLKAMKSPNYQNGFELTLHEDMLGLPLLWKQPQTIFVNSMSDLFHKDVPLNFIKKVFSVMNDTPQHTYQVLTKRSDLLLLYDLAGELNWTANIWMGVSIENEEVAFRLEDLLATRACVKFLSCEPLIGSLSNMDFTGLDWVIVGGESGPRARPIQFDWAWEIKNKCQRSAVPFFFKQWGKAEFNINPNDPTIETDNPNHAKGGCMLANRIYRNMPRAAAQRV